MLEIGPKLVPKIGQNFLFLENKKKLANRPGKGSLVEAYAKGNVLKPAGSQMVANGMPGAKAGHRPKYHFSKGSTAPSLASPLLMLHVHVQKRPFSRPSIAENKNQSYGQFLL